MLQTLRFFFRNKPLLALSVITLIGSFSFASQAAESDNTNKERWFQVEMIVFSRAENNPQENWPTNIKLSYPVNVINLKPVGTDTTEFTLLPANERQLNAQAATLAKSGSYGLLFHEAWRQPIYNRSQSIFVSGGKWVNGHQELEGSIALSLSVYLKLQTNLWLTKFGLGELNSAEEWPELPKPPTNSLTDVDAVATHAETQSELITQRVVKLNQTRSLRSNEIHYIDHPLLGVIVKIIPYDPNASKPTLNEPAATPPNNSTVNTPIEPIKNSNAVKK